MRLLPPYGSNLSTAGCFLPLSQNVDNIPKDLGTRHRAGIGITEVANVISIVISEETGTISLAIDGDLIRGFNKNSLKREIVKRLLPAEAAKKNLSDNGLKKKFSRKDKKDETVGGGDND